VQTPPILDRKITYTNFNTEDFQFATTIDIFASNTDMEDDEDFDSFSEQERRQRRKEKRPAQDLDDELEAELEEDLRRRRIQAQHVRQAGDGASSTRHAQDDDGDDDDEESSLPGFRPVCLLVCLGVVLVVVVMVGSESIQDLTDMVSLAIVGDGTGHFQRCLDRPRNQRYGRHGLVLPGVPSDSHHWAQEQRDLRFPDYLIAQKDAMELSAEFLRLFTIEALHRTAAYQREQEDEDLKDEETLIELDSLEAITPQLLMDF